MRGEEQNGGGKSEDGERSRRVEDRQKGGKIRRGMEREADGCREEEKTEG